MSLGGITCTAYRVETNYGEQVIPWFLGYSMLMYCPHSEAGWSLMEKKSVPIHSFPKKARGHTMCRRWAVGGWRLAVGDWRLVAVCGGWWQLVVGDWWLMVVGSGWRLAVGGRWRLVAVGG